MNYQEYVDRTFRTAVRKGWHEKVLSVEHFLMLVITEVSEMIEADRKGKRAKVEKFKSAIKSSRSKLLPKKFWTFYFNQFIKDTVEDEMADVCIRLFDLSGLMGWELEKIDAEAAYRIFTTLYSQKTFTEIAFEVCGSLYERNYGAKDVSFVLALMEAWAKYKNIDLEWHINQKMKYNEGRSYHHGGKAY